MSRCVADSLCHRMGFLLSEAAGSLWDQTAKAIEPYGLVPRSIGLLDLLKDKDGLTQQELGLAARLDRTSMVLLIDGLEKEGLVERGPHPTDRRCHQVKLTKKGKEVQKKIFEISKKTQDLFLSSLSKKEQDDLQRILLKLVENDIP